MVLWKMLKGLAFSAVPTELQSSNFGSLPILSISLSRGAIKAVDTIVNYSKLLLA